MFTFQFLNDKIHSYDFWHNCELSCLSLYIFEGTEKIFFTYFRPKSPCLELELAPQLVTKVVCCQKSLSSKTHKTFYVSLFITIKEPINSQILDHLINSNELSKGLWPHYGSVGQSTLSRFDVLRAKNGKGHCFDSRMHCERKAH